MQNDGREQSIISEWKRILPNCVKFSCGNITDTQKPITELERSTIGDVDILRLKEFSAGRAHAHHALAAIEAKTTHVPKCQDSGKPIWPNGFIGSITHTQSKTHNHVAAAVANIHDISHLGIDAELNLNLHPNLWQQFLTKNELADLAKTPVAQRHKLVNILWCLKESAIKASGVNDMLHINCGLVDYAEGIYSSSISIQKFELLLHGLGVTTDNITLAVAYSITKSSTTY